MTNTEQEVYDKVKAEANNILSRLGFDWDTLPDTNSIWDWVEPDMTDKQIKSTAKDCCWDRLYDSGMDRDLTTEIIYGNS
jgi:hypothetical protein